MKIRRASFSGDYFWGGIGPTFTTEGILFDLLLGRAELANGQIPLGPAQGAEKVDPFDIEI